MQSAPSADPACRSTRQLSMYTVLSASSYTVTEATLQSLGSVPAGPATEPGQAFRDNPFNATRYHSGGIAGLRPNEVPTILERGEEVITKSDVRHRMNGGIESGGVRGAGSGGGRTQTQVLAIGDKEIAGAMAGASGRDVFITHLKREKETIRQILRD